MKNKGDRNIVIGKTSVEGDDNIIIGATDSNGNVILANPMVIGNNINANPEGSIVIGSNINVGNYNNITTIYNNGYVNNINTGNNNSIMNSNNIIKNDYESLKKELKKLNIQDKEIENLERILSREKPDNNELGSETKGWISKMKDLGVAVSAEILATMIKSFLGIVD